jgi:hypothetical protein
MNPKSSPPRNPNPPRSREVPRDRQTDDKLPKKPTPSPATSNPTDEDYADAGKPLVAGSPEAIALHNRPPPARGELGVGTAGDAARPIKPGIHDKPIPPRGTM